MTLSNGILVHCILHDSAGRIAVEILSIDHPSAAQKAEIRGQLRTCLRMDEDFAPFHAEARRYRKFRWIAASGSGRMLRAPTMFEDAVKMICTTNCTWALTTLMVTNLVQRLGRKLVDGLIAFPTPGAIASLSEREIRSGIKSGYRSGYILELARRVSSGELRIESWRGSELPSDLLFKEMRSVKGIGSYAAGNLLKLAGRYDELGLDSWVRAQFFKLHKNGRKVKDSTIARHYEKYGRWRGLFFWLEMTRDWHDEEISEQESP